MRLRRAAVVPLLFLALGSGVTAQTVKEPPPPGAAPQQQRPAGKQKAGGAPMLGRGDDEEAPQVRAPEQLKLFQLMQIEAVSAQNVVSDLFGQSIRVAIDTRSNSLIVNGTDEELAKVEAIILRLEETAPRQIHWQVYKPKFLNVAVVGKTMQKMFPDVRVQEDSRSGKLLFEADEQQAKKIVAALNELDSEMKILPPSKPDPAPAPDWQLRIVWIVEKDAPDSTEDAIPSDLKAPLQKLKEKTGIKEVKSVAQSLVNITGGDPEFKTFGTATIDSSNNAQLQVACHGNVYYDENNENPSLSITATVSPIGEEKDGKRLTEMDASIKIKPKRPVIIGMNSINGKASIVVVEMIPADEEK
jgi:hypothetical protein